MRATITPILLAAGGSSRFEGGHKLLAPLDLGEGPKPVAAHAYGALLAAFGQPPLVVLGARADEVRDALGDPPHAVVNPHHAEGMGTSLAVAAQTLRSRGGAVPAVLIALADMPLLNAAVHRAVAAALGPVPDAVARAFSPSPDGPRPGHPVGLGPDWLARLARLDGDAGLRDMLRSATIVRVPVDPRSQLDVDTRDALARAAAPGNGG